MLTDMTPGKLANLLGDAIAKDADISQLADIINEHFLNGAWGDETTTMSPVFLKDIRGIIIAAYKVGFARGAESAGGL